MNINSDHLLKKARSSQHSSTEANVINIEKPVGCSRIITINTWKGDGNYDCRMQMMAMELYNLQPDIVCLQEAVRSEDCQIDTAEFLADFLGLEMIFAPARLKTRSIGNFDFLCHSGLAILSAYTIDRHWISSIPTDAEDPERMAFSAQMYHGNQKITVTNLHLTHIGQQDGLRHKQFASIIEQNSELAAFSTWLCCGDFNCSLDIEKLRPLEKKSGLTISDCYLGGNGRLPSETLVSTCRMPSVSRIDYIFNLHLHDDPPQKCQNSQIVLNNPDFRGHYPSDHFGVSVDINLLATK
jgi:endonuclease/exonuclease/phosphatase family metal-dependent hydrolase